MADVIVGLAGRDAGAQWQERSGAVQGLHLAFLVHRQHDGAIRRTEIQPDDVAHLLDKLGIGRQFERVQAMRLQPKRLPEPRDRRFREARHLRHAARRPLGRVRGRTFERPGNHVDDPIVGGFARRARPRLVGQAGQAADPKPLAPFAHAVARHAEARGHRPIGEPLGTGQYHPRSRRQSLRRGRAARPLVQGAAFVVSQHDRLVVTFSWHAAQRTNAATEVQDFF